jgi:hypothetical protein
MLAGKYQTCLPLSLCINFPEIFLILLCYVDVMTVPFSFGRLKTSNFVINDKRISATHCILTKKQDQIYIEDKRYSIAFFSYYFG